MYIYIYVFFFKARVCRTKPLFATITGNVDDPNYVEDPFWRDHTLVIWRDFSPQKIVHCLGWCHIKKPLEKSLGELES